MSSVEFLPRGFGHGYINDVLNVARQMGSKAYLDKTPEGKFVVIVQYVFLNTMPHTAIQGIGTTLEDAAADYMRQIRGHEVLHVGSDKKGSFI
jgi:hypothetical protein